MRSNTRDLMLYSIVSLIILLLLVPKLNIFYSTLEVALDADIQETPKEAVLVQEAMLVEEMPPVASSSERLTYKDLDVFCLAKNIYHEAGIESEEGKYAVAQVTLNRVNHHGYPNTICDVVMDPYQFSWANQRSIRWTHPIGPNWRESYRIARKVLEEGYRHTGLERVKYYHADYVHPRWADQFAMRTVIGRHIFYEDTRAY